MLVLGRRHELSVQIHNTSEDSKLAAVVAWRGGPPPPCAEGELPTRQDPPLPSARALYLGPGGGGAVGGMRQVTPSTGEDPASSTPSLDGERAAATAAGEEGGGVVRASRARVRRDCRGTSCTRVEGVPALMEHRHRKATTTAAKWSLHLLPPDGSMPDRLAPRWIRQRGRHRWEGHCGRHRGSRMAVMAAVRVGDGRCRPSSMIGIRFSRHR